MAFGINTKSKLPLWDNLEKSGVKFIRGIAYKRLNYLFLIGFDKILSFLSNYRSLRLRQNGFLLNKYKIIF